jgi:hypothetical protein
MPRRHGRGRPRTPTATAEPVGSKTRAGRATASGLVAAVVLVTMTAAGGSPRGSTVVDGISALRAAATAAARQAAPGTDRRLYAAGFEAYVWGSPLVIMQRTRAQQLCLLRVNSLLNVPSLFGPSSRFVVTPNADTLYSTAALDLRGGPMVLRVPDVTDRYYGFQFLDMYTDTIADVGTRTNGGRAGAYAIVGPGWRGRLPAGVHRIDSPTPDVWAIGRTLVTGPTDQPAAAAEQRQYVLEPLPTTTPVASGPRTCPPPASSPSTFVNELTTAMAADPPLARDRPVVADLARAGIGPGLPSLSPAAQATVALSQRAASQLILGTRGPLSTVRNGWSRLHAIGTYGTSYLARATVAAVGLGANVPAESVYFFASTDTAGGPLAGTRTYVIHFGPGGLPPVDPRGFWSVTLYGPDHFLVANPSNRYEIGDRTPGLIRGPDGSLDVYVANQAPPGHEANWLPAPAGGFSLVLRAYLPSASILGGTWSPPGVGPA